MSATEIKRIEGNTASYGLSAQSGLTIRVESEEQVTVQYSYFSHTYDRMIYEPEQVMDLEYLEDENGFKSELGFMYGDTPYFLSEFMRDNFMAGVR